VSRESWIIMEDLVGFKGQDELIRGGMEELIGLNCWPDCFHDNHCRWHLLEPVWRISLSPSFHPQSSLSSAENGSLAGALSFKAQ
jgi:hypothetical protein